MPGIDGIISGIDTSALIEAITATAMIPLERMNAQLELFEEQKEKIAGLNNRLSDLSSYLADMNSISEFSQFTATAEEGSPFTVSVDSNAIAGNYNVEVRSLASADTEISDDGWDAADKAGVFGHGDITVTYAGVDYLVAIDDTNDDPTGVAAAISEIAGVTAFVLDTGDGDKPFRLVIQGEDSGADNTLSIDTSNLGGGKKPTFSETATATDSEIAINGITIYSDSNIITAMPGLTINLTDVDPGSEYTITVARDTEAIEATIQGFVDLYNEFVDYYETATVYNTDLEIAGPLVGDGTARRVVNGMADMISSPYTVDGAFEIFAQIGIETQQDGTLKLDTDKLSDALANNFDDVAALFTDANGPAQTLIDRIDDLYVAEDTGTLQSRTDSLEQSIETQQERIERQEQYIDDYVARLRSKFNAMELAMANFQNTSMYLAAIFATPPI